MDVSFFFRLYGTSGEDLHDNESDVSNRLGFSSNPEKKPGIFVQNYLNTSILVSLC